MDDSKMIPSKEEIQRSVEAKLRQKLEAKKQNTTESTATDNIASEEAWEAKLLDAVQGRKLIFSDEMNAADQDIKTLLDGLREARKNGKNK